jgi:hypothetical protein
MPIPNGGLITETNRQYYAGSQGFYDETASSAGKSWTFTFNTDLIFGSVDAWDPSSAGYGLNNFKLYLSTPVQAGLVYDEYILPYIVLGNTITITGNVDQYSNIVVQLKSLDGGNYGIYNAYGNTVEENYGGYSYIKLDDIINNFIVAYVGDGKLIQSAKRTDIMFHAKRGLQEFSYDTLKSVKSQELSIPPSLSIVLPQDYVNYVKVSWIDSLGVKHIIYPANNLTINPYETPSQDTSGVPLQDSYNNNIEGTSITEERWDEANTNLINGNYNNQSLNGGLDYFSGGYWGNIGNYTLNPQYSQLNGWFTINDKEGKMSFSSQLVGMLIVLEYISDGLAYDIDTKIPKMAEEAMYAHIIHAVISTRANQPEYLVQRLKQERSAKLRNTKIRLSNIKLEEITQVLRGQSKWIKH